jgi:signal transduction histidine kinase
MNDAGAANPGALDQSQLAMRRARGIAVVVIAVLVVVSLTGHPRPGVSGRELGVSVSLAVLIAATVTLLRRRETTITAIALIALTLASASIGWLQPGRAGTAGLFVAVALAGIRLPERPSAFILALALASGAVVPPAGGAHRSAGMIAGTELGIIAFYLVARFGRAAAEAQERTRRLLVELQASRDAEAEAAMLRERSRLARDMHDVLAHSLSGLMLQLEGARMLSTQPDANGRLSPALDRAHHLARAGLEEARRAIAALRDEDLPGPDRLAQLAEDFEHDTDVPTSLQITGATRKLDSETSLTVYRVAQEALTNIRRHATPARVEISLGYEPDGTRLTIRDHVERTPATAAKAGVGGVGGGGYGLTGMRERAELLGGSLSADHTPHGFRVELWVPA